ncbi:MAG: type II toxin-antitoxin system VapC family toxin [Gammaproteobacteria bacterium]|nr:type II toxin-antitoxin system VapC family toxin [Gammaproteobacteria bacterium]
MIGIDTNVLVRVLIDDHKAKKQCEQARSLLLKHEKTLITDTVLIETIWVIQRAYSIKKPQIISTIERLLLQSTLVFDDKNTLENALETYRSHAFEFSDALILTKNQEKQCSLYTFDKKLSKHASATHLNQTE